MSKKNGWRKNTAALKSLREQAINLLAFFDVKHIIDERESSLRGFWQLYNQTFEMNDEEFDKKRAKRYFYDLKQRHKKKIETKRRTKKTEEFDFRAKKEIKVKDNFTNDFTSKFLVDLKDASNISFASKATADTLTLINEAIAFQADFCKSYMKQLQGFTDENDNRFKFASLKSSKTIKLQLEEISNELMRSEDDKAADSTKVKHLRHKLSALRQLVDTALEIDMQPINLLSKTSEALFNQQKALNGAIVNDKALIENNNITIFGEGLDKLAENTTLDESVNKDLQKLADKAFDFIAIENITKATETTDVIDVTDTADETEADTDENEADENEVVEKVCSKEKKLNSLSILNDVSTVLQEPAAIDER